jgi:hypothetical protein
MEGRNQAGNKKTASKQVRLRQLNSLAKPSLQSTNWRSARLLRLRSGMRGKRIELLEREVDAFWAGAIGTCGVNSSCAASK